MRENSIFSRRSIRKFKSTEIPLEITEKIIKAGAAAPSAKNRQPWKCIVLQNKPKEDLLAAMEAGLFREEHERALLPKSKSGLPDAKNTLRIMREAPVLIAVLNTNGKSPFSPLDADERFTEICDSLSIGAFVKICFCRPNGCILERLGSQTPVLHRKNCFLSSRQRHS